MNPLIEAWRSIIVGDQKSWVLFKNGTCVILMEPEADLTKKCNREIAPLFDKLPSPGGDHCPMPLRLFAPIGREVWVVGGDHRFIKESDWPEFAARQVALLVAGGFSRDEAERLYSCEPKDE